MKEHGSDCVHCGGFQAIITVGGQPEREVLMTKTSLVILPVLLLMGNPILSQVRKPAFEVATSNRRSMMLYPSYRHSAANAL
jgi:hypothetical protein